MPTPRESFALPVGPQSFQASFLFDEFGNILSRDSELQCFFALGSPDFMREVTLEGADFRGRHFCMGVMVGSDDDFLS